MEEPGLLIAEDIQVETPIADSLHEFSEEFAEGFVAGVKTIPASVRRVSGVYNAASAAYKAAVKVASQFEERDPEFDLHTSLQTIPEDIRDKFLWCRSQEDIDWQNNQLAQEQADNEMLKRYPAASIFADLAVGIVEAPLTPMGSTKGLLSLAKEITRVSAANVAARYANQDLMTFDNVVMETVAAPILGTAIGVASKGISAAKRNLYQRAFVNNINSAFGEHLFEFKNGKIVELAPDANGAYNKYSLEDMHPFIQKIIKINPILQGLTSESEVVRRFADAVFSHNFVTSEVKRGVSREASAQAGVFVKEGITNNYIREYYDIAKGFLKSNTIKGVNYSKFSYLVAKDIRDGGISTNPYIKKATDLFYKFENEFVDKAVRRKVFGKVDPRNAKLDPKKKILTLAEVESGKISEEISDGFSKGYFSRLYNKDAIRDNIEEFQDILRLMIIKNNPNIGKTALANKVQSTYESVTENQVKKLVEDAKTRLKLGESRPSSSMKKGRTILVEDAALEKFLINDPVEIMKHISRQLSPEIELNRISQESGFKNFGGWSKELQKELRGKIKDLKGEARKAVEDKYNKYARFIEDSEKLFRGSYDLPETNLDLYAERASNLIKACDYLRHMGGVAISAIPDQLLMVNRFGFWRSVHALVSNTFGNLVRDTAFKLNRGDLSRFGAASEAALLRQSNRYLEQTDMSSYGKNLFDIGLEKTTNLFSKLSLMPYIDDFNRTIASTLHATDIIKALKSGDVQFLSQARIAEKYRGRILQQFQEHGGQFDKSGLAIFDTGKWTDKEAAQSFRASIVAASRNVVLKPSAGEVPKVLKSKWGRFFTQYQSFEFALFSNTIAQWLNGQTENLAPALITGLGLGYLSAWLQGANSGDMYQHFDDPALITSALEKSGIFPVIFKPMNSLINAASFWEEDAKHATNYRTNVGNMISRISPQISFVQDVATVSDATLKSFQAYLNDDEYLWTEREMRIAKGLVPFNNLIGVNAVLNNAIREHAEDSGARLLKTREDRYWESKE